MSFDRSDLRRLVRGGILAGVAANAIVPGLAYAAFTDDIATFFQNLQGVALAVYYGIVGLAFVLCLIAIGKELIPAVLKTNYEERASFKGHLTAAVIAAVVLILLLLAPTLVSSALVYFGATGANTAGII